jgi:putative endonuclease
VNRLVYFEWHEEIGPAIKRERAMKHWSRAWKVNLVLAANPYRADLFDRLA